MSTRKPRSKNSTRKRPKSEKATDEAKVFVLTPNILEKLGIDLGNKTNENHSKGDLSDSSFSDSSGVNISAYSQKQKKSKKSESNNVNTSLSETADLMKNSVLLSPSFSQNVVEGTSKDFVNVEVIDDLNAQSEVNEYQYQIINEDYSTAIPSKSIFPLDIVNTTNEENINTTQNIRLPNQTDETCNDFVFKVPFPQSTNVLGEIVKLPDSNVKSQNKAIVNTNDPIIECPNDNKIEELHLNNNSNNSKAVKDLEEACKTSYDNNSKAENQLKASITDGSANLPTRKSGGKLQNHVAVDNSTLNNKISKNSIAMDNKVKEVANYLSKCVENVTSATKHTEVISKSSIQGVEKPGGELKVKTGSRTYERKNKHKANKHACPNYYNYTESSTVESGNIEYVGLPTISNEQSYCICCDFGAFMCAEDNIHFSNQPSLPIQSKVLYEIYNDEGGNSPSQVLDSELDSFVDITQLDQSDLLSPICWNIFETKENYLGDPNINMSNSLTVSLLQEKQNTALEVEQIKNPDLSCSNNEINADLKKSYNSNVTPISHDYKECSKEVNHNTGQISSKNSLNNDKNDTDTNTSVSTSLTKQSHKPVKEPNIVPLISREMSQSENSEKKELVTELTYDEGSPLTTENSSVFSVKEIETEVETATNIEKVGKKRKKSFSDVIPNKKSLKCGVCAAKLSKHEWDTHNEEAHCFVAWQSGQDFNDVIDNDHLSEKLESKIKTGGLLKCVFCEMELKEIPGFIKHVKKCKILKDVVGETHSGNETKVKDEDEQLLSDLPHHKNNNESFEVCDDPVVKCGVCSIETTNWIDHISKEHKYIAWKDGEEPVVCRNENDAQIHLNNLLKEIGEFVCYKCGLVRKRAKPYLKHIKACDENISFNSSIESDIDKTQEDISGVSKCGVCAAEVNPEDWIDHIAKEHQHIAWKEGDKPLNIEDEEQIKEHLHKLCKVTGGLKCPKCGIIRKYAKVYMVHVKDCPGEVGENSKSDSDDDLPDDVRCGVCKIEMKREDWMAHIEDKHNYMAWWDNEEPLDITDEDEIIQHLRHISSSNDGLRCTKCDFVHRHAKRYLKHVQNDSCTKNPFIPVIVKTEKSDSFKSDAVDEDKSLLECGRCHQKVDAAGWTNHAMNEHYNIAWPVGDTPINLRNQNSVDRYLKAYLKKFKAYRCKVCDATRVSSYGFYAHILVCGKSDEEKQIYEDHCDICNEKYLCVYKSQHMTAHRESEFCKLRRKEAWERKEELRLAENVLPDVVSGKRRAAEKALSVIGNLTKKEDNIKMEEDFSDSDESLKMENVSTDSSESDVDSNISHEELEQRAMSRAVDRSHHGSKDDSNVDYAKALPFRYKDKRAFITKSAKDFAEMYCSKGVLFSKWRPFDVESLDEETVSEHLPKLMQSCLIHYQDSAVTMKRFEAIEADRKAKYVFVGGTIRQLCWVPVGVDEICDNYLTVLCHNGSDVPGYYDDELVSGPGSIQLWNCKNFTGLPRLSIVLVHEYGEVWSASWCPSGARDQDPEQTHSRLGLLAAACSNGLTYILSIPNLASDDQTMFIKAKPVAELRMTSNNERRLYQATSVCWCPDKGHDTILVGYSDGTLCYFNINSTSPMLTSNENGVDIFYPYDEIRAHSRCITGVGAFPGARRGAVCSGGAGGAALRAGGRARRSPHPVQRLRMSAHWPAAYVAGDSCLLNSSAPTDVEAWGGARRLGVLQAAAECARCGLLAAHAHSQLRLMRPYPASGDLRKLSLIAIDVKPLQKIKKVKSDGLGVVVEPWTYEEMIQKYGLVITRFTSKNEVPIQLKPHEVCIERFPLNAVTSMDFCSSSRHHNRLAVGTHAGLIIIMSVI